MGDRDESFARLARALRDYLSPDFFSTQMTVLILFSFTFVLIWLLFFTINKKGGPKPAQKDWDFFNMVVLQKGLEIFDRDLLFEVASTYSIQPIYKILLERDVFEKVLKRIQEDRIRLKTSSGVHTKIDYLRKLRGKLFPGHG